MSLALLSAGVVLLLLAFVDAAMTTLAIPELPGPLTRLLSTTVWRGVRRVTSRSQSRLLRAAGPLVTLTVITAWVLCLWFGWALVFASVPEAVIDADSGEAASFASKIYYTATTIITTGIGDFVPSTDLWRVVSGAVSISGLALVTLAITYLLPVTTATAAVDRMTFAQQLSTLGATPEDVLARHWDGAGFDLLVTRLEPLVEGLVRLRTENLAYPVLHFFHGADTERALAPRVAALDEALTIMERGLAEEARLPRRVLLPVREAVDALLHTVVSQTFARPHHDVPPAPSLERLGEDGIPTVVQEEFEASLSDPTAGGRGCCPTCATTRGAGKRSSSTQRGRNERRAYRPARESVTA